MDGQETVSPAANLVAIDGGFEGLPEWCSGPLCIGIIVVLVILLVLYFTGIGSFFGGEGMLPASKPVLGATTSGPGLRFGSVKDDSYAVQWTPGDKLHRSETMTSADNKMPSGQQIVKDMGIHAYRDAGYYPTTSLMQKAY